MCGMSELDDFGKDFPRNPFAGNLTGSPFLYSSKHNVVLVIGCGSGVIVVDERNQTLAGCAAVCSSITGFNNVTTKICYGIGCCQTTIPFSIDFYQFKFLNLKVNSNIPECTFAKLIDSSSDIIKTVTAVTKFTSSSVILKWTVADLPITSPSYANSTCEYKAASAEDGTGYVCRCKAGFFQGNPYLPYGCQVVKECNGCIQDCLNLGNDTYGCPNKNNSTSGVVVALGVGMSVGSVLLLLGAHGVSQLIEKRRDIRLKAKYFERNGGLILKQQMSSEDSNVENIRIFTSDELEKATDGYNEDRVLGQGGQGTVYKGMLSDGKIVAIKKSKIADESQLNVFVNEVVVLSHINHRNVVKLLGCCLEMEVPLLVYEFIPNGTLSEHIHDPNEEFPVTWEMRLQIATDIANALAYLHSSSWVPIFHRDIKSSNILLDNKYRAKLSDFGISKSVAIDQTHITTRVMGTLGYVDPEYFRSNQFTDKSDVYSFGVVLVELLTAQKAVRSMNQGEERGLVSWFLTVMENSTLDYILDARVSTEGGKEEVIVIANLARRCLNLDGKRRPTMKEVAADLETVRSTQQSLTKKLSSLMNTQDESSFFRANTISLDDEV